jgi:hypothetical protein
MIDWNNYAAKKEQYRDQLREAEKRRLIKLCQAEREGSALWASFKNLVSGIGKRQVAGNHAPGAETTRLTSRMA